MSMAKLRIAINGFGRIGRTILRQILTNPAHADIEIVAINDIAPHQTCAYLFQYDSVFGPFPQPVRLQDGALQVAGRVIPFRALRDISGLDLSGVDLVLECTGAADTPEVAARGLAAGAAGVLISGPSAGAEVTAVLGANEAAIGSARIVSNASCTTNALAPLLKVLDAELGIVAGHMTTIHCYTGSQPMVDAPRGDPARSRAGAVSMVPTTTSATRMIGAVLPGLAGKISGAAVRVPCISVSAIDLSLQLRSYPEAGMNAFLCSAFDGSEIIGLTDDPVVSTDMRGRPQSLILALPETLEIPGRQVRLFGWYDNEWGFSARMIDMARIMSAR